MSKIIMLKGIAGSGKGQPVDSILPTPEGDKKIGELKVGDYVFGSNGKPTKVIGVFPRGVLPLYKVVFKDGATLVVDGDHIWTFEGRASRGQTEGRVKYNYSTKDLYADPTLVKSTIQGPKQLPLVSPLEYEDGFLEIDPYILGLYLADGCCRQNGTPRITKKEQGVVEYMLALPGAPHNKHAYGENTPYYTYSRGGNPLYSYLKKTGLVGKNSAEKFVPEEIFTKSVYVRKRFLYGLMDGDGSLMRKRGGRGVVAKYSTTSEALKNGVVRLVTSLGGATKTVMQDMKRRPYWQISIYTGFNPFLATHEAKEWKPRHYHLNTWRALDHIEKNGYGEVVCIAVEAKDQLYVGDTQHHIVTHNTTWAKEQVRDKGYVRVSMDDLRESVVGGFSERKERFIRRMRDAMVREALSQGRTVIVDATNLNPVHEWKLREIAEEMGARFEVNDSFLERTPEECIEADLHRGKDAVGADVIYEMYNKWIRPLQVASLDSKSDKRRCVIVDLDGTLAINSSGRSYYDMTLVDKDTVNPFVSLILDGIQSVGSYYGDVLLVSGRSESGRELTEKWLENNAIPYQELFLRADGDKRKDVIVKEEILREKILPKWMPLGAIDNSRECCSMYYNLGIETLKAGIPGGKQ